VRGTAPDHIVVTRVAERTTSTSEPSNASRTMDTSIDAKPSSRAECDPAETALDGVRSCDVSAHPVVGAAVAATQSTSGNDRAGSNADVVGCASKLAVAIAVAQARDALVALGWKPAIARAAVDDARAHVGAVVEDLIREALRRYPMRVVRTWYLSPPRTG
jgi:hypothetical protein